jgi:nucleoside diphosphate kinase
MWDDLPNKIEEVHGADLNNLLTNDFARHHVEYENVVILFKTTTASTMKDLAKEMGLQYTRTKKVLWDRIIKSGHLRIISSADDGQSFMFRREKEVANPFVQRWITLTPEVVPEIEGMDMVTGAEREFFGPTNPNNAAGATRSNFCSGFGERISRPEFGPKKPPPPAVLSSNHVPFGPPPPPSYEKGHPSPEAYEAIGDIKFARPKDFFDLQISPKYISNICKGTNYRASAEGVGLGKTGSEKKDFGDFKPFDNDEMYKFI